MSTLNVKKCLEQLGYRGIVVVNMDDIKRKYRSLSKVMHPDLGGSEDDFKKLTDCYDFILLNCKEGQKVDLNDNLHKIRLKTGNTPFSYLLKHNGVWGGISLIV